MANHIFLILKNLRRNKRRSMLTLLSTGISVFLIGSLISVYGMFYRDEVRDEAALRLITRHKVSLTQALPYYYRAKIQGVDGAEVVVPMNWFGGTYIDQRPEHMFARFAVDPEQVFDIYSEYQVRPEQLEAFKRDRQGFAVGKSVADKLGFRIGQRITLKGDIYPFDPEFTIRAIFEGPDDFQSFFHFKYLEEALPELGGMVGVFAIRLRSPDDASRVALAVDEMFRNSPEADENGNRSGVSAGVHQPNREHQALPALHRLRDHVHNADGLGQYSCHVGSRADAGDRRSQDARIPFPIRARLGARRGDLDRHPRRRAGGPSDGRSDRGDVWRDGGLLCRLQAARLGRSGVLRHRARGRLGKFGRSGSGCGPHPDR